MHKEIAKITSTMLGIEDHGCMSIMLTVDYGGSGQGIGVYALDEYDRSQKRRVGIGYGMEFVERTLNACGVSRWESIKGRTIYVLKESDAFGARVIGIAPLPTEPGEPFVFDELNALANKGTINA